MGSDGHPMPPAAPGAVFHPTPGDTPLQSPLPTKAVEKEPASLERIISPAAAVEPHLQSGGYQVVDPQHRKEHPPSRLAKDGVVVQTAGTGKPPRLIVYEIDGVRAHEHHLRPERRQEKLKRMLKDLFKRHDEEHAESQVPQLRVDPADPASAAASDSQPSSRASSRGNSPPPSPGGHGHHHLGLLGEKSKSGRGEAHGHHSGAALRPTGSAELDRDAADAVVAATGGNKPPSLLSGLAQQLRSQEVNPDVVLNELMAQRNLAADPSLSERYGHLTSVVGKGSFGVVRLAQKADPQNKNRKLVYAVKEFHPNHNEAPEKYLKRLASEFCLASSLHHTNVIQTLDLLNNGRTRYCGVMEYCAGGDLYSLIVVSGRLEPLEADCFFKQIMRGVAYMHSMGVAHRDLKPENVLLTSRGCCKITDFGNAECFRMAWEKDVHLSSSLAGSGPYIAPEEYKKQAFDPRAVDVWAVGVIYMAMSTGRHLWHEAKQNDEFFVKYLTGRKDEHGYEPIERLRMPKRRNVIYSVLDPVASRRLTAAQALNSEWGREICVCEAGEGELPH